MEDSYKKIINWGIIGCGLLGRRRIIPALREARGAHVVAAMDQNREVLNTVNREFGVQKCYTNLSLMLEDKDIDAVFIASPNYLHCSQTIQAAKAEKHVLCEKPMAINSSECQKMIKVCREHKVKFMVGHCMRFHGVSMKAKEIIDSGKIGEILLSKCFYSFVHRPGAGDWRYNPKLSGGGPLLDIGVHCFDMLRFLLGQEVKKVSAMITPLKTESQVETNAHVLLEFEGNIFGIVDCSFQLLGRNGFEIHGTKGSLFAYNNMTQLPEGELRLIRKRRSDELKLQLHDVYVAEIEHFSQCILNNQQPLISGKDGLETIRIVEGIYKSSETGQVSVLDSSGF